MSGIPFSLFSSFKEDLAIKTVGTHVMAQDQMDLEESDDGKHAVLVKANYKSVKMIPKVFTVDYDIPARSGLLRYRITMNYGF